MSRRVSDEQVKRVPKWLLSFLERDLIADRTDYEREIKELREALEPFAREAKQQEIDCDCKGEVCEIEDSDDLVNPTITIGDLRRAARLLEAK